jgi:hypothetical protein
MTATQPSKLLSSLFAHFDVDQRLTVLHIGPALPETVEFFSRFRSKLFFVDVFGELPIAADPDGGPTLEQRFTCMLDIPPETRVDICLFWDIFNFLDGEAITAFLAALQPHLHSGSLAHGFAVYNRNSRRRDQFYGIRTADVLNVRNRPSTLPGYAPHPQGKLKNLLHCFDFDRSMLLADSRLELLLRANLNLM